MEIITPIGAAIIGLGVATWICTFIAVCLACKAGYDHSFAPPIPIAIDHGVIELHPHEITDQNYEPHTDSSNPKIKNADQVAIGEPVHSNSPRHGESPKRGRSPHGNSPRHGKSPKRGHSPHGNSPRHGKSPKRGHSPK